MARIVPHGWREASATGAAAREIETLARLADGLPDDYTVYHGVHWTRLESGVSVYGDIDFVVVAPSGRTLLIEQKSGFLQEAEDGLTKVVGGRSRNVVVQLAAQAHAVQARFAADHEGAALPVEILLFCPDYRVRQASVAGIEPSRIVDASRRSQLAAVIREALPLSEPSSALAAKVHRFFRDVLELAPEVGALAHQVETLYTRLSGGLAEWGRRLEFSPFRLHVVGTAGSGKTQLALAVFRDAVAAGRRPLYVCYNRPLADHMHAIVPPGGEVYTYHQLCERVTRGRVPAPDYGQRDAFAQLERALAELPPTEAWRFDVLLVDEGQDFDPAWRDPLLRLVREGGKAYWMEDPLQRLYAREPVPLDGWVTLHADTNYRTPHDVLDLVRARIVPGAEVRGGSPVSGSGVDVFVYETPAQLADATKRAITAAVGQGFRRPHIGVVTFRGREGSALSGLTHLGPHRFTTFTGRYDLLGNPVYSEGDLLLDSVYRFKGRSAPCVVFTEVDFEQLDNLTRHKLFVGATRASMKLLLVLSRRAADALGVEAVSRIQPALPDATARPPT